MIPFIRTPRILCLILAGSALAACNDSDDDTMQDDEVTTTTETLCAKYGGPSAVDQVVRTNVIGAIAEDCRVNAFFTTLSEAAFTRVNDCLSLQVQELFACEGVSYAGSEDSNGLPCRSMADAHRGLGISSADFNALIEDVVAGLSEAGVEDDDIQAAAPALLGMESDIVEAESSDHARSECSEDEGSP